MAVDPVSPADPATDPYPAIFRQQILRSIRYLLTRLDGATSAIPEDDVKALALHVLDFALQMAADQPEAWRLSAPALTTLAPGMEQAGHRTDWAPYLARGLSAARRQEDWANAASLHFHLGVLHQLQGHLAQAETDFVAAVSLFAQVGQVRDQARAMNRRAYVLRLQGENRASNELVFQALDLLAEGGAERGYCAFVLGCNAFDAQAWEEAAGHYQQALDLWQVHGEIRMVAWNLTNLGTALRNMKQLDKAAASFRQALALFDQIEDPTNQAITRMNLGTIYLVTDQLEEAERLYVAAEEAFRRMGDDLQLAKVYNNLGLVYQGQKRWDEAEKSLLAGIQLSVTTGNIPDEVNSLDNLGGVYRDSGRPDLARSTWQKALTRLASAPNAANAQILRKMVIDQLAELE